MAIMGRRRRHRRREQYPIPLDSSLCFNSIDDDMRAKRKEKKMNEENGENSQR